MLTRTFWVLRKIVRFQVLSFDQVEKGHTSFSSVLKFNFYSWLQTQHSLCWLLYSIGLCVLYLLLSKSDSFNLSVAFVINLHFINDHISFILYSLKIVITHTKLLVAIMYLYWYKRSARLMSSLTHSRQSTLLIYLCVIIAFIKIYFSFSWIDVSYIELVELVLRVHLIFLMLFDKFLQYFCKILAYIQNLHPITFES